MLNEVNNQFFNICRVFVNRSLHLEKIKFYGFDMDYTLAGKERSFLFKQKSFSIILRLQWGNIDCLLHHAISYSFFSHSYYSSLSSSLVLGYQVNSSAFLSFPRILKRIVINGFHALRKSFRAIFIQEIQYLFFKFNYFITWIKFHMMQYLLKNHAIIRS